MKKRLCLLGTFVLSLALSQASAQNPYLPLWEHIPDGEPYVFEDPDHPGRYRVYVYGSHDVLVSTYCGLDQVVWSAPVNDLTHWRFDGVIFESDRDANGKSFSKNDLLYAPDVCEVRNPQTGKKTYYFYPNTQAYGRGGMVAKADRPDGPFRVCNWNATNPMQCDGILGFDPAVFIDDDGRVYAYWGGGSHSQAAELDPKTMATLKPGTKVVDKLVSGSKEPGIFRFFEASSIRKIKDKYVFVYSRFSNEGEWGLGVQPGTLAYAYSDAPLGPYTYGGTVIDLRGRDTDERGNPIFTTVPSGNTHGGLVEVNGQWYIFYHRQTGLDEFARQAMVAPVNVQVEEGKGGKVYISEGEVTSEGFHSEGLNPLKRYSAGIACWHTGPKPAIHKWPNYTFFGSYIQPSYAEYDGHTDPYDLNINHNSVVNNTNGSIVGYKYFNFDVLHGKKDAALLLQLMPKGNAGRIDILLDSPWESRGGILLGSVEITSNSPQKMTEFRVHAPAVAKMKGKHALFFRFHVDSPATSLCDLHFLQFVKGGL